MRKYLLIIPLVFVGALTGCFLPPGGLFAQTPQKDRTYVQVDSINSGSTNNMKTYALLAGNKGISTDDLQFKEFATYLHRSFTSIGLTKKDGGEPPDYAIFLSYGIGEPQVHHETYSVPTWGVTGYSSSTYGTVNSTGSNSTYFGTTKNTPNYGITGVSTESRSVTTYFRWIILEAYDVRTFQKENKMVPVWKTTVTSQGSSDDLRRIFPLMVAGSTKFIGANTGQKRITEVYEDDEIVLSIKGIAQKKEESILIDTGKDLLPNVK